MSALRKLSVVALALPLALGGVTIMAVPSNALSVTTMLPPPPPPPPANQQPPQLPPPGWASNDVVQPNNPNPAPAPANPAPAPAPVPAAPAPQQVAPAPAPAPKVGNNAPTFVNEPPANNFDNGSAGTGDQVVDQAAIDAANEAAATAPEETAPAPVATVDPEAAKVEAEAAAREAERAAIAERNRALDAASPKPSASASSTYAPNLPAEPSSSAESARAGLIALIASIVGALVIVTGAVIFMKKVLGKKPDVDPRRRMLRR